MSNLQLSLVVIRGIHFAAASLVTGTLFFRTAVAEPVLISSKATASVVRSTNAPDSMDQFGNRGDIRRDLASVGGRVDERTAVRRSLTWKVLSTILSETQFGRVSEIRFVLAIILAACLAYDRLCRYAGLQWAQRWGSWPLSHGPVTLEQLSVRWEICI